MMLELEAGALRVEILAATVDRIVEEIQVVTVVVEVWAVAIVAALEVALAATLAVEVWVVAIVVEDTLVEEMAEEWAAMLLLNHDKHKNYIPLPDGFTGI